MEGVCDRRKMVRPGRRELELGVQLASIGGGGRIDLRSGTGCLESHNRWSLVEWRP